MINRFTSQIHALMKELCVPMRNKGYDYIFKAVEILLENPKIRLSLTKAGGLYEQVATYYGVRNNTVERCIRTCVEAVYLVAPTETIKKVLGGNFNDYTGKITNGDFLYALRNEVLIRGGGAL